jgi:polar amino acid transport system substrate-binding protein
MPIAFRQVLLMLLALATPHAYAAAAVRPDCTRPLSLALHEHGLLYSARTGEGIDRDIADELISRSGCKVIVSLLPRARIWQLIESGALDLSLSGVTSVARERFASFAWYESNRYYLLVRKDSGVKTAAEFESRPSLLLGATRGFRYGPAGNHLVDALDAAHRVTFASALDPLYPALLRNGVQALIIEPFDSPIMESTVLLAQTALVELDDPPIPHGLIMSKKSLSIVQQQAWRTLIDEMRADGTIERIYGRFFAPELARALTSF